MDIGKKVSFQPFRAFSHLFMTYFGLFVVVKFDVCYCWICAF